MRRRLPLQQRRDAARDHAHLLAHRESVRFTHFQVAYERPHVSRTLDAAWRRALALWGLFTVLKHGKETYSPQDPAAASSHSPNRSSAPVRARRSKCSRA